MTNDAAHALVERESANADEIRALLEPGQIKPVYQPVVRVGSGEIWGYEGFARFPRLASHGELGPAAVLALAGEVGLRAELELACWEALAYPGDPPAPRSLILNISPASLSHRPLLDVRLPERTILELSEPPALLAPLKLREQLAPWRQRGCRVVVDEGGAGHAVLEHLVELQPDFLKLSRQLVSSLEQDASARARLRSLVEFAREAGAQVIGAGVETEAQLSILHDNQVELAQGYLFGRPEKPWAELARTILPPPRNQIDVPPDPPVEPGTPVPPAPGHEHEVPLTPAAEAAQAGAGHLAAVQAPVQAVAPPPPAPTPTPPAPEPVAAEPVAAEPVAATPVPEPAPIPAPAPVAAPAAPSLKPAPDAPLPTASLVASGQALVDASLDDLASLGLAVTVYVQVHGVLRCRAVRGAWQVADGVSPSDAGVGETFRTGTASQPAENELCVPCLDRDKVVGVVRVMGHEPITETQKGSAELCARVVGPRLMITEPPTRAQLLARRARRLSAVLDPDRITREALAAAMDLTDLNTAAVVLRDEDGGHELSLADGPGAVSLSVLGSEDWSLVGSWVAKAAACVTSGLGDGSVLPGGDRLRDLGVRSLAVVALNTGGRNRGFLLAAGDEPAGFEPESVELLELLGHHVASALEAATAVDRLREQVSVDPVTGLPRDDALADAVAEVRALGGRASVVAMTVPSDLGDAEVRALAEAMRNSAPGDSRLLRPDGGFLLVFAPEGPAHASTVAALAEARGAVVAPQGIKADVLLPEEDEDGEVLRARAAELLARMAGPQDTAHDVLRDHEPGHESS